MSAESAARRVQLVSEFLIHRIGEVGNHEKAFAHRIKSVSDHNSIPSINSFAHDCNLSRRQFERKFKEHAGFSPKDFFQIVRFKNVLRDIGKSKLSLSQLAINAGYYDQSHLTNEFKKFSGYTPKEYVVNHQAEIDLRATREFKE